MFAAERIKYYIDDAAKVCKCIDKAINDEIGEQYCRTLKKGDTIKWQTLSGKLSISIFVVANKHTFSVENGNKKYYPLFYMAKVPETFPYQETSNIRKLKALKKALGGVIDVKNSFI